MGEIKKTKPKQQGGRMKTYTFATGELKAGLSVSEDERLGTIVYIGEAGRGRRYEKVGLFRKNPAEVIGGCIQDAHPVKITVNRGTQREREFYTLAKPHHPARDGAILIRINTSWCYTRNSMGGWEAYEGTPENLVSGHGAHGIAGRIGIWRDGIVVMRPGDVLKVKPEGGYKTPSYALWMKEGDPKVAEWNDYENLRALEQAEEGEEVEALFGYMPVYSYESSLQSGIEVSDGKTGTVIALGEAGRGRKYTEVPVIGSVVGGEVAEAALGVLDEQKNIFALMTEGAEDAGNNEVMVRIRTLRNVHRQYRRTEAIRGNPQEIASGLFAGGDAGFAGSADDTLWVLKPGDAVVLTRGSDTRATVIENDCGELVETPWGRWEKHDSIENPDKYIESGKAPWGHVPESWVGRIVEVLDDDQEWSDTIGEIVSVDPLVLNPGWDACDYHEVVVDSSTWIKLDQSRVSHRLEGEEFAQREEIKADVERLKSDLDAVRQNDSFQYLDQDLRKEVIDQDFRGDIKVTPTDSIRYWVKRTQEILLEVEESLNDASDLKGKTEEGNVLPEFEVWHRAGGVTGRGDGWVIRSDGSLREPDEKRMPRFKSDGNYFWNLVNEDELALVWNCGTTRDVDGSSDFTVAKLPVNGLTDAQCETVAAIESDIGASVGVFGLDPEIEAEKEQLHELVISACEKANILASVPEDLGMTELSGDYGIEVPFENIVGDPGDYVDHGADFDEECSNREAQVVEEKKVGSKNLQFLVYHKYGYWNLNIRLK